MAQSQTGEMEGDFGKVSPPQSEEEFRACNRQMALLALMEKTGYNMLQVNGQRMYGGPPPGWEGPPPPRFCEVFVGKIPRDMYEVDLVPLFERAGKIYELRLMLEFNGNNRGYTFIMYTNREDARRAIQMFDNYEIRPGKFIGVCLCLNNCRLFISCIPKDKTKEEIEEEMRMVTDGVVDVITKHSSTDNTMNRGYAFIEYESHKAAAMARKRLIACNNGKFQLWGHNLRVNWAKPEKVMEEMIMQRVQILYVRNLIMSTTEETLYEAFSHFKPGCVERVRKLTDYAFIHYHCHDDAMTALDLMNGACIDGNSVEVMLARPAYIREGSGTGKRCNSRGSEEGALASNGTFCLDGSNGEMGDAMEKCFPLRSMSVPTHPGSPMSTTTREDPDRYVFHLLPGTPLSPTSLQVLKPSQIRSAVNLLDFYCIQSCWSLPQYQLFTTPGQDGKRLLLYKVVIPSLQCTYVPDKLCVQLEDAKELAAKMVLHKLGDAF